MKPSILITGFGPFPGVPINASGLLVARLARTARRHFPDARIHSAVLPTQWLRGPALARSAMTRAQPDIAIHFGVSSKAQSFVLEECGVNACLLSVDEAGALPPLSHLEPEGPAHRLTTLPVGPIIDRLRRLGLPAVASDDAGRYLCNAILYQSLGHLTGAKRGIAGFVHLPAVLASGGPLTLAQAVRGSLEIIAVCLEARAAMA